MSRLDQAELRRLLSYLRNRIADADTLARFEDEFCAATGETIATGPYAVYDRVASREASLTLRFDVDFVSDDNGQARVVTVFIGRGRAGIATEIELP